MSEAEITELCVEDLSTITKYDRKYPPNLHSKAFEHEYTKLLGDILVKYGIVEANLMKIICQTLCVRDLEAALIELLETLNPAFRDLLSVYSNDTGRRSLFLYGLLKGKMMNGATVRKMAKKCLNIYRKKK